MSKTRTKYAGSMHLKQAYILSKQWGDPRYSNEIQQSLRYFNTLNELLSSKKIEEENINLEIENKEKIIHQLENNIDNLNERKGRIDYTQLIKEPTSSLYPVSPKKKLNVLIASILGLMAFTILAFFLESLEKQKTKSN